MLSARWRFLLVFLLLLPLPVRAQDDDDGEPVEEGADPVVLEVERERAEELLDLLEEAEDAKDVNAVVGALEPFFTARHEKFVKPLSKLATHRSPAIRVAAVKALGSQEPDKRLGAMLFKVMNSPQNKDEPAVVAMAISSLRRIRFDAKPVYDELESHFRKQLDPAIMGECARYFGDLKKVEAVEMMVYWVEAPQPASVNSGSNPPASYWKRMWDLWAEVKKPVMKALEAITGKSFDTKTQWAVWLDSREAKELGIR